MESENFQIQKISSKQDFKCISNYKILKRIGFGSSGLVYKVTKKNDISNKIYILKQIPYSEPNLEETTKKANSAKNEALILSKLSCKYIVKYYDSFIDNDINLNIIMEYCDNGDLNTYINNQKKLKKYLGENEIWNFFIQISLGLAYIHSKKILHRDLKPMNIFLTKNNQIKIGDLGVAKFLTTNTKAMTYIGTPHYLSPEICKENPYNSKGDVWALGCILYELCTFERAFSASNPAALILKIINGNYVPLSEIKNGKKYSKELEKMIEITLEKNYLKRPLMIDIINSKIFEEKAILYGFKQDLIDIRNLYKNNDNYYFENESNDAENSNNIFNNDNNIFIKNVLTNKGNINKNEEYKNMNDNHKNKPSKAYTNVLILHSGKKNSNLISQKNGDMNQKKETYIHSIKTRENYLVPLKSTSDSSHNNDNNIKIKEKIKPKNKYAKYSKYIIKKENNNNKSTSRQKSPININNKIRDKQNIFKNNLELKPYRTKLKMLQISPVHYRDSSDGKNKKNNFIIADFLFEKNKRINSNEKKYINKTKNDIYSKANNKNKLINNSFFNNINNANNIKIKNISINNTHKISDILPKKNYSSFLINNNEYNKNNAENISNIKNLNKKVNKKNNINNITNINNININNMNINYSLNLIGKTRSNFYSNKYQKFINMKSPIDSIKMHTANGFNNLHQFRIENCFEDTENYKCLRGYEINNRDKYCNAPEDSIDDSECNVESNLNDDEMMEDSDSNNESDNDNDEEEKVLIVNEKNLKDKDINNNNNNEDNNIIKKEYLQKYYEYKNKIMKFKNDIDISKLFSMYEKLDTNTNKFKEIENYLKNNLPEDKFNKFRKIFNSFIFYDIELQNLKDS